MSLFGDELQLPNESNVLLCVSTLLPSSKSIWSKIASQQGASVAFGTSLAASGTVKVLDECSMGTPLMRIRAQKE